MSIRTTVSLDDDVVARLKEVSSERGVPFRALLNEAVRSGLLAMKATPQRGKFKVEPVNLGVPGMAIDNIGAVIEAAGGLGSGR